MNPDQDNFEQLRRLLALKRHEQPPPGYFDGFSRQVLVRIKAGDLGEAESVGGLFWEAAWLQRLLAFLEGKPALAGAFGLGVCGFLLAGVICSVAPQQPGQSGLARAAEPLPVVAALQLEPASASAFSSTNGMMPQPLEDSLFEQHRNPFRPVLVSQPAGQLPSVVQ